MRLGVSVGPLVDATGDVLVLGRYAEADRRGSGNGRVERALGALLTETLRDERFDGRVGTVTALHATGRLPVKRVVVVGLGPRTGCTAETIRRAAAAGARRARDLGGRTLVLPLLGEGSAVAVATRAQAVAEGVVLGVYAFDRYKAPREEKPSVARLVLRVEDRGEAAAVRAGLGRGELAAEATSFARDLINEPANHVTATALADTARRMARAQGLRARIYDRRGCARLGMGAFLGVNRGSSEPPRFIHLAYVPRRARKRIALVGKGITFDSGGLDLKTAEGMAWMKGDMSGAAAVLGVMRVLSRLRPAVEVHGLIAATDNMPSGSATKPGDILRAMSGKTIEVNNTDAEGRLTIADAIGYALRVVRPDEIVDIATLTGACAVALGSLCAGALSNNAALQERVLAAAEEAGERMWPLPLVEEYREGLKSDVADLKNTGPRYGGAITAGLFIKEFANQTPWVHLDIAGPAFTDKDLPYASRGGVGFGTRTLLAYVLAAGSRA
jgi:leucyl aminopeptidase